MCESQQSIAPRTPKQPSGPECLAEHVLNCQFSRWYPLFERHTPRSIVIPLPQDVVRYLQADGVVLPKHFEQSCYHEGETDWDDDDDTTADEGSDSDADDTEQPEFPDLLADVKAAIQQLGGTVFPKLNWSSPKDAAWINGGSLKCSKPGDVLCLLKSSVFIGHDLEHAFDACARPAQPLPAAAPESRTAPDQYTLVLRKWCNLQPSMLFRCFVRGHTLIGISQRDCTGYYGFLKSEAARLGPLITSFFDANVKGRFPDPDYVMDLYVDRRDRVWLLDFNVFAGVTDSLLFQWDVLAPHSTAHCAAADNGDQPTQPAAPLLSDEDRECETDCAADAADLCTVWEQAACEFRVVPDGLNVLGDSMAQYRGPVDTALLMSDCAGALDLDAFIAKCEVEDSQ